MARNITRVSMFFPQHPIVLFHFPNVDERKTENVHGRGGENYDFFSEENIVENVSHIFVALIFDVTIDFHCQVVAIPPTQLFVVGLRWFNVNELLLQSLNSTLQLVNFFVLFRQLS